MLDDRAKAQCRVRQAGVCGRSGAGLVGVTWTPTAMSPVAPTASRKNNRRVSAVICVVHPAGARQCAAMASPRCSPPYAQTGEASSVERRT